MDCPKCVGELQTHTMEGVDVDVCFICEGIWFDAGKLEDVLTKDSKDFDYIDVGQEDYDAAELKKAAIDLDLKPGKCPRCADGVMLVPRPYEKKHTVRVDLCPKGHGIWLDG